MGINSHNGTFALVIENVKLNKNNRLSLSSQLQIRVDFDGHLPAKFLSRVVAPKFRAAIERCGETHA
jgi:hypothetical protein